LKTGSEISNIAETAGPSWVTPAYSRAGNMTTMPQPADPTQSYAATYDAWNRLVKIADGSDTVAEYQYDGANRRIVQKSYTGGVLDETRHLYYTEPSLWQVLEERAGTSPNSADAERQFVWGMRYIDDLVLRDRDTDDNGSLDERLYALQDANWNVAAILDDATEIQERYAYTLYGTRLTLGPNYALLPATSFVWSVGYAGYIYLNEVHLYLVRYRFLTPLLGTWTQRDPLGAITANGLPILNLTSYVGCRPTLYVDPAGLAPNPFDFGNGLRGYPKSHLVVSSVIKR
jgi:RHS repeat-associated protein